MAGEFYLGDTGLSPLSDIHTQVASGLSQLTGAGAPQAADVAASFGNIAFSVNSALDSVSQSRMGTIQTTRASSDTIAELLAKAQQMYAEGDRASADKLKAAAEALSAPGQGGSTGGTGGASGPVAGGGTAGGDMAGQLLSQIGQQIGQAAQSVTQPLQGLAQGLQQLPQQVMQGVQGIFQAAAGAAGGAAGAASAPDPDAAADREENLDDDRADGAEDRNPKDSPPPENHDEPSGSAADNAQQGADSAERAPVERSQPQPAQTRPQQSSL